MTLFDPKDVSVLLNDKQVYYSDELLEISSRCENLRQEYIGRFKKGQIEAQNTLMQEVLDNGESLEDYSFYETTWFEGNVWHYKCWKESNNED